MAASAKRPMITIDLTGSDDDDAPPSAHATPYISDGTNGAAGVLHNHNSAYSQTHASVPPFAPAPTQQVDDARPAKRARRDSVWNFLWPIAETGARQAAMEDSLLVEETLRKKLLATLLYQFETRLIEQAVQVGGMEPMRSEIMAARRRALNQLRSLPECRRTVPPYLPSASSAQNSVSIPNGLSQPASVHTNRPISVESPPISQASPFRPAQPRRTSTLKPSPVTPSATVDMANGSRVGTSPYQAQLPRYSLLGTSLPQDPLARGPAEALSAQTPTAQIPAAQIPDVQGLRPQTTAARSTESQLASSQVRHSQIPNGQVRAQQTPAPQAMSVSQRSLAQNSTPQRPRRRNVPDTPTSAKDARTIVNAPTTPQNFHARAKTAQWKSKSDTSRRVETHPTSYFALSRRPYVGTKSKEAILRGNGRLSRLQPNLLQKSEVFHVDFSHAEIYELHRAARKAAMKSEKNSSDSYRNLEKLLRRLKKPVTDLPQLALQVSPDFPTREADDILAFFNDILNKQVIPQQQQMLCVEKDPFDTRGEDLVASRMTSLLLARESSGNRYGGRRLENFTNEFRKTVESNLQIRTEFTNCAGDISTISWISDHAYIAGTTVHMDSHNQQYNKPGNLVLGSVSRGNASLKAYADHRVIRPIVQKGENSSAAMRETQDPWLYTSVVFSDFDPIHNRVYTCSFDKTVKAWKVGGTGVSMRCIGSWMHGGPVNFVQASLHQGSIGLVATAADVPSDAVRVYEVSKLDDDLSRSRFTPFSCSRITSADGIPIVTDKWTYCPSTMKWGIEKSVQQYLLVGYSPRSISGDDGDIPPERLNTGELCMWDASTGYHVSITSAKNQNVFEVLWHPTQPYFIAATSPKGVDFKDNRIRTQVRIFRRTSLQGVGVCFSEWKALDCMAADINELTIVPNSVMYSYVTAGCTDGKTYVWDTALGDKPIQILSHGPPLEGIRVNDAEDDTGVKFTAWGSSLDRFYTGSSDGVVKVWNVRSGDKAKGKVVLEASAQISSGAFSPDKSRLIVGDASGRVFVLSVNEDDGKPPAFIKLPGAHGSIKRRMPTEIEHHVAPPPPREVVVTTGVSAAREFLAARQLRNTGDPTIGAVQDINYPSTGFFRRDFHFNHDPTQELLAHHTAHQQDDVKLYSNAPPRTRRLGRLIYTPADAEEPVDSEDGRVALLRKHEENCKLDLKYEILSPEIRDVLSSSGLGQRELLEGPEYPDITEDDEAELKKGTVEVLNEAPEEPVFWE